MNASYQEQARTAMLELCGCAKLHPGDIVVVGCSSSEVGGHMIGSDSRPETAAEILDGLLPVLHERGLFLAAQCCEHLNRALIVERTVMERFHLTQVNVVPQPKAGGSFATAAYAAFDEPVAVESLRAQAAAGLDIGGTLIGMHIRPVVVPAHLSIRTLGSAMLIGARSRPKFVGGNRAVYDETLF